MARATELIRTLVKLVEIDRERVNVVFRVEHNMGLSGNGHFLQHCRRVAFAAVIEYLSPLCAGRVVQSVIGPQSRGNEFVEQTYIDVVEFLQQ